MTRKWKSVAATGLMWLIRIEQLVSVVLLATVVTTMAAQVIWRYVLQSPLSWSEEVSRLAMIWLTFIASGFVSAKHQHIAVDLIGDEPPVDAGRPTLVRTVMRPVMRVMRSQRLVQGVILITTTSLLLGGLRFVRWVYPVGSPGINISMSYWYGAAIVGLALISLHTIADLLGIQVEAESKAEVSETGASDVQVS